jgi:hypothetical protein
MVIATLVCEEIPNGLSVRAQMQAGLLEDFIDAAVEHGYIDAPEAESLAARHAAGDTTSRQLLDHLLCGCTVVLRGLVSRSELNDRRGEVRASSRDDGRIPVSLKGERHVLALKPENLAITARARPSGDGDAVPEAEAGSSAVAEADLHRPASKAVARRLAAARKRAAELVEKGQAPPSDDDIRKATAGKAGALLCEWGAYDGAIALACCKRLAALLAGAPRRLMTARPRLRHAPPRACRPALQGSSRSRPL